MRELCAFAVFFSSVTLGFTECASRVISLLPLGTMPIGRIQIQRLHAGQQTKEEESRLETNNEYTTTPGVRVCVCSQNCLEKHGVSLSLNQMVWQLALNSQNVSNVWVAAPVPCSSRSWQLGRSPPCGAEKPFSRTRGRAIR